MLDPQPGADLYVVLRISTHQVFGGETSLRQIIREAIQLPAASEQRILVIQCSNALTNLDETQCVRKYQ